MKKFLTLIAFCAAVVTANAQYNVSGHRFFDNWSIGVDGGVSSNFHDWDTPNGAVAGLQLTKGITPVVSFEFSAQLGINDNNNWNIAHSSNAIDNVTVLGSTKINLMNWFCGYKGQPRLFEIQARGGFGYMREFYAQNVDYRKDVNRAVAKFGFDFDFNLGQKKAWTISVRPAVVLKGQNGDAWCDNASMYTGNNGKMYYDYNCRKYSHNAVGQITAGVTYHFRNSSNSNHYFTAVEPVTVTQTIEKVVEKPVEKIVEKPVEKIVEKVVEKEKKNDGMECYVYFNQGKSNVTAAQMPNVERIATFLKNNSSSKVTIKGYASPEGSKEINEKLANNRAEAVKNLLINKYGIDASRISAEGMGVGDTFSEPDWNRVDICTIEK